MAIQDIFNAIMEFDEEKVRKLTQTEVAAGTDLGAILNQGLIGAMDTVGEKFSAGPAGISIRLGRGPDRRKSADPGYPGPERRSGKDRRSGWH